MTNKTPDEFEKVIARVKVGVYELSKSEPIETFDLIPRVMADIIMLDILYRERDNGKSKL